jgi:hypothetical protein
MDAAAGFLAAIKLGQDGIRGGLLIDYMVGSATPVNGLTQLSNSLPRLNAAACKLALLGLSEIQTG